MAPKKSIEKCPRKGAESSSKKIGLAGDKIIEEVNAEDGDEEPNTTLETGSMKRQDSSIARNNDTRSVSDSNVGNLVPSNGKKRIFSALKSFSLTKEAFLTTNMKMRATMQFSTTTCDNRSKFSFFGKKSRST